MTENHKLPESISEIHLGFLSGKHYVGKTDVSYCTKFSIAFDGFVWKVKAEWTNKDGTVDTCEKTYDSTLRPMGIFEKGAWKKSPWNTNKKKLPSIKR